MPLLVEDSQYRSTEMELSHPAGQKREADNFSDVSEGDGPMPMIQPRAYQIEMFEESLKGNTIVCVSFPFSSSVLSRLMNTHQMDTGSG